jgi:microcystin-dependent protein
MSRPRAILPRRGFLGRIAALVPGGTLLARADAHAAESQIDDQQYIGEIRLFAGFSPPYGWFFCEGQLLPIGVDPDYDALFSLIGTMYGGDGQNTFALPDLRGRAPVHFGSYFGNTVTQGEVSGAETHVLISTEIPAHTHTMGAGTVPGNSSQPPGRVPTRNGTGSTVYHPVANSNLASSSVLPAGGSQPHDNMQPYLAIRFMIAYLGIYPSRS